MVDNCSNGHVLYPGLHHRVHAEMSFERLLLDIGGLCFGIAAVMDLVVWLR